MIVEFFLFVTFINYVITLILKKEQYFIDYKSFITCFHFEFMVNLCIFFYSLSYV
jgi:hypothetical protein